MKILYFDCSNGISGDMLLKSVSSLSGNGPQIYEMMEKEPLQGEDSGHGSHEKHKAHGDVRHHEHSHGHGRSFRKVRELIENSGFSAKAKETALEIYGHIAKAEAKVHGATLETVHFHEVGRDEAVKNALAIGMALEYISPDRVLVSDIYDGHGTILCSHGEISVPVPAVMALRENCSYTFRTADVETEMVTPSGLAGLMGIGAEPEKSEALPDGEDDGSLLNQAKVLAETEAKGSRPTGRPGLKAYILEI